MKHIKFSVFCKEICLYLYPWSLRISKRGWDVLSSLKSAPSTYAFDFIYPLQESFSHSKNQLFSFISHIILLIDSFLQDYIYG